MDKLDFQEKVWGGIFAIVAVAAAIVEMFISGADAAAIVGAVKDIFGTLVVIVLFVTVIKSLTVKKPKNFREALNAAMEQVEKNYYPLVKKAEEKDTDKENKKDKLKKVIRYEILSNVDCLFGAGKGSYLRYFDIDADAPSSITFFVREKFFGSSSEIPFDPIAIAKDISNSLAVRFPDFEVTYKPDKDGGEINVDFRTVLSTYEDSEFLSKLIDITTLLFVARNKKV